MLEPLHQECRCAKPLHHLLAQQYTSFPLDIAQRLYLLGHLYIRIVSGQPKNFEGDHLTIIRTLPNFGHLGDAFRLVSLPHDTLKFIQRWDGIPAST